MGECGNSFINIYNEYEKKAPVDSQYVLQNFSSFLSPYEKEEIVKYNQVYYLSDIYHKLIARSDSEFDDERYRFSYKII